MLCAKHSRPAQLQVQKEGTDVTLVGYGKMVGYNLDAAEELQKEGISCEVSSSAMVPDWVSMCFSPNPPTDVELLHMLPSTNQDPSISLKENTTKSLLTSRLRTIAFVNATFSLSDSWQQLPPDCIGKFSC